MTIYGLTPEGFVLKPLDAISDELKEDLRGAYGQSLNFGPSSGFGQFVGIMSERHALLWQLAQEVHAAMDPDAAIGASLDAVSALTGTFREGAEKSAATLTAIGTPGTILSAGRVVSVVDIGTRFETLADATILALAAWQASTAYVLGQRATNTGKAYQVITGGTSAASGGPTTTAANITDNTVHWKYLGTATGAVDIAAEAQETGPLVALSGTLTVIETPVGGWVSVVNLLDAELGREIESDPDLRVRREEEIFGEGNAVLEAIKRGVLAVEDVEAVVVFQNTSLITDGDGVPGKAVEVLVQGGDDAAIRAALFAEVGAGIETHGTVSGTVTDSSGIVHTIKFSRPTERTVYSILDVVKDPAEFPADGATQIRDAVVAYGDTYPIGKDVVAHALRSRAFLIPGVLNVTNAFIGVAPAPATEATISVTSRQRATFDTSRVTVNVTNGTP